MVGGGGRGMAEVEGVELALVWSSMERVGPCTRGYIARFSPVVWHHRRWPNGRGTNFDYKLYAVGLRAVCRSQRGRA